MTSGEEVLSALLGAGFIVLNGYRPPPARRAIQHVVIGPSGVHVVEDVVLSGHVRIRRHVLLLDGEPMPAFAQSVRRHAMALQLLMGDAMADLGMRVSATLWVRGARMGFMRRTSGVRVATDRDLPRALRRARKVLSPAQVGSLSELARSRLQPSDELSA